MLFLNFIYFLDIHELVRNNDLNGVKELLLKVNCISLLNGDIKNTPLHTAAWKGHAEIAELLINSGADIKARNKKGSTPSHIAVTYGRLNILKLLILRDKSLLNIIDFTGNNLLNIVAQKGHEHHVEILKFLLAQKADISIRNKDGNSAYHYAVVCRHLKILKILLHHDKCHINETNNKGQSLLHLAASKGYNEIVKCLLLSGASTSLRDYLKNTAFESATVETAKVFIKYREYKSIVTRYVFLFLSFSIFLYYYSLL